MSDSKLVKLIWNLILNGGPRDSNLSNVSSEVKSTTNVLALETTTTLTLEKKKVLTPHERLVKRLIIGYIVSLIFMIVLGVVGGELPNKDAVLGRYLMLISEVPAFLSSVFVTRLFFKGRRKKE